MPRHDATGIPGLERGHTPVLRKLLRNDPMIIAGYFSLPDGDSSGDFAGKRRRRKGSTGAKRARARGICGRSQSRERQKCENLQRR